MKKTPQKEDRSKVFTLRLSEADARSLYLLAEIRGIPASVLVRSWIKESLKTVAKKSITR